jgi:hypothetical protein
MIEIYWLGELATPELQVIGDKMSTFRVIAITEGLSTAVRATQKSPQYGHPAHADIAKGYGPCRQCLRTFHVGVDRRILFTYDPFEGTDPFPLPGPVFIHETACTRYAEDAGFPEDLRGHALTLNAYGNRRRLRAQEYVSDGKVEPIVEELLARPDVDYIHVRDTVAGCYDFSAKK